MVNGSPQTSAEMNSIQLSDEHDLCTIKFLGKAGKNVPQACFQFFFGKVTHYWIIVRRTIGRESQLPDTCYKQEHPHSLEKCWCFYAFYSSFELQASVQNAGTHECCHFVHRCAKHFCKERHRPSYIYRTNGLLELSSAFGEARDPLSYQHNPIELLDAPRLHFPTIQWQTFGLFAQ